MQISTGSLNGYAIQLFAKSDTISDKKRKKEIDFYLRFNFWEEREP